MSSSKIKEVYLSGGYSYPYLPLEFRNHSLKGINFGAGYGVSFEPGAAGYSSLYLSADYNLFRLDEPGFLKDVDTLITQSIPNLTVTQRPVKILNVMITYRGTFTAISKAISPYFLIGAGYMYLSVPPSVVDLDTTLNVGGENHSSFAWTAGIGLDIPINESMGLFVQMKSVLGAMNRTRQYFPLSAGVRFRL